MLLSPKAAKNPIIQQLNNSLARLKPADQSAAIELRRLVEYVVAKSQEPEFDEEDFDYLLERMQKAAEKIAPIEPKVMKFTNRIATLIKETQIDTPTRRQHLEERSRIHIRDRLTGLVQQLSDQLERTPENLYKKAKVVAELTARTVEIAFKETPNKMLVQISAAELKAAAVELAVVYPVILPTISKIVDLVLNLSEM